MQQACGTVFDTVGKSWGLSPDRDRASSTCGLYWQALPAFMQVYGNSASAEQFHATGPVVPILWLSMSVMMPVCGPKGRAEIRGVRVQGSGGYRTCGV